MENTNLGRDKLTWKPEFWQRIDKAVDLETHRTEVASKFIPLYGPLLSGTRTVASDVVELSGPLTVDEVRETGLGEISVEFALTKQQYEHEERLGTAVTLATRAANVLAQVKDLVIFQGERAIPILDADDRLFKKVVKYRLRPTDAGLSSSTQVVEVHPIDAEARRYGENTFKAVAKAYSDLQKAGHYGPYALVLHADIYADTYAPLPNTLIMPADRIKPLMTAGFFGTGTMPASRGFVVSVGGNSMDIAVGVNPITAFTQVDKDEQYVFRLYERLALRLKDHTAVVRLRFLEA